MTAKNKIISSIKDKFLNADGSINKTVLVSFITLLIVLVDQILAAFGVTPTHQDQIVAIVNTLLTILGLFGFVEGGANDQVEVPKTLSNLTKKAPKIDSENGSQNQNGAKVSTNETKANQK